MLRRAAQTLGPETVQLVAWVEQRAQTAGGVGALGPRPPLPILTPSNGLGLEALSPQGYAAGDIVLALPLSVWGPTSAQFALEKAQATAPAFYQTLLAVDEELGGGKKKLLQPVALATHLSLALLDPDDAVHPYARFLYETSQKVVPHPLLLGPQVLREGLQASPVVAAVKKRQELFTYVHQRLFGSAATASTAETDANQTSTLPLSVFLWSLSRVLSRAVSGPGKPLTFLPFYDLINHRRTEANCEYILDINEGTMEVKATKKIEGGEELFLCYSDTKDNHQMFLTYGFVEEGNPVGVTMRVDLTESEERQEGGADGEWVIGGGVEGEGEERARFECALAAVCEGEGRRKGLSEGEGLGVMKRVAERRLRQYETSLEEDRATLRDIEGEGEVKYERGEGQAQDLPWRRTTLALLVEEKRCLQRALDCVCRREKEGHDSIEK